MGCTKSLFPKTTCKELCLQFSVVLDEPKLAEFVHEHAHARPRGADNLRERLLANLTGSVLPSLPKFAIRRSTLANRFSLELNRAA
jgi:hypothetical protein